MVPKFKHLQLVRVRIVRGEKLYEWYGNVLSSALPDDEWEYLVSNAPLITPNTPLLAWESEIKSYV